ncbi:glycosyltransferase family 2 protein [candidate division CSSED10-310 bacterium]|uniref:Glycosyltransferase family 2 protein n=1 Tax=candidate division CSSED10-310 bacterium TaxID=2855610 RepID=A0ABV6Z256_UNCC1
MNLQNPLISVIIPAYNYQSYLAEAIESVLAQTYHPTEIIVINDGSTDGTETVAKQFVPEIRYFHQPNQGLGTTRNRGVQLAQGDFLAFLDADDVWLADKLLQQYKLFNDDCDLDMAFGYAKQFFSPEIEQELKTKLTHAGEILPGYIAGTLLIKRVSFIKVGLFETDWRVGEFIDWYSKAQEQNLKCVMFPQVVMKRRIHNTNMGIRERQHQTDYVRILKASLDRRRQAEAHGNEIALKKKQNR